MSVNHEKAQGHAQGKGGAPAHVKAVTSGELVNEKAATQMQQDAAGATTTPPASHVPPVAEPVEVEVAEPAPVIVESVYHALTAAIMVTLDLTNPHMNGLKKILSAVDVNGDVVNLYSPFRKAGKPKGSEVPPAEGILRSALESILDITDRINDSKIMLIGAKANQVNKFLGDSIKEARSQMQNLLPLTADSNVASLVAADAEEGDDEIEVEFQNIVKLSSWTNSPLTSGEAHEVDTVAEHNAVFNITVNAGMLYDSTEKVKAINQIETILRLHRSKRPESKTEILLAVMLNPSDLANQETRDLLDTLIGDEEFALYTRSELLNLDVANWLPTTKAEVERDLLAPAGDLLLVQLLGDEEEGEAGEGDAAAEPAAA